MSAVHLERQVEDLHGQLLNLQLEKQLGVEVVEGIANPHLATHKRLTALIDTLKHVKVCSECVDWFLVHTNEYLSCSYSLSYVFIYNEFKKGMKFHHYCVLKMKPNPFCAISIFSSLG